MYLKNKLEGDIIVSILILKLLNFISKLSLFLKFIESRNMTERIDYCFDDRVAERNKYDDEDGHEEVIGCGVIVS